MSVTGKIKTFTTMPWREKLAFAEAAILLAYARILVNCVPLSRWRKQIAVTPDKAAAAVEYSEKQKHTARMVMRTIRRVGRNVPVEFVCLPQALSARWMLSRRGVPTTLYLGTRHAAEADREFHAWLKVGKMMITGHCDESEYVIFGTQRRD